MSPNSDVRTSLRRAILDGTYTPGVRLVEAELAEEFSASRFVLRNALIQLESEGLIEIQPNRGARVRKVTPEEAVEISEVRQAVESLIAARAAKNVTDDQIAFLTQLGADMQEAVDENAVVAYSELNTALHSTLRNIAAHENGNRILEQINGQMVGHQFQLFLVPGRPSTSLPEHLEIIRSVCARNPEAARAAMFAHVGSVVATLASFAEKSSQGS